MIAKIAITNQKGGVGKTTTSVNLAASLAISGFKVLLVDLDPQGHAGQHIGIKIEGDNLKHYSILEVLEDKVSINECVYKADQLNSLYCLPSNLNLGKVNQLNPSGKQFLLKQKLTELKMDFDFIIFDCQPSLSLLTLNALTSCDLVLLPVQAEFFALDGLTQLILTFKEVRTKLHPKLKILGILLTMFDRRNRLSGEVKNELFKTFQGQLFNSVIPRNVKLAEAPSFSQDIFTYDSRGQGAKAYQDLAKEILDKLSNWGYL